MHNAEFLPHLTVGQFSAEEIEEMKMRLQENWVPIVFDVKELCMIARDSVNQPFRVIQTIPLISDE